MSFRFMLFMACTTPASHFSCFEDKHDESVGVLNVVIFALFTKILVTHDPFALSSPYFGMYNKYIL